MPIMNLHFASSYRVIRKVGFRVVLCGRTI
nr:MAG TPA: hypothetical protein [Caudoviricetes sp.]